VTGVASLPPSLRAQQSFTFGAILPLSGLYAPLGDFIGVGLRLGVAQVNEQGGILGRQKREAEKVQRAKIAIVGDGVHDFGRETRGVSRVMSTSVTVERV
jgi:hypothetical protein